VGHASQGVTSAARFPTVEPGVNERCYVFFDVDDTLIEWTVSWPEVFVQAAAEVGVSVTFEQARHRLTRCLDTIYDSVVRAHAERADERAFWLDYDARVLARLGVESGLGRAAERVAELMSVPGTRRLFPDAADVLEHLAKAGAKLGIITGRPRAAPDLGALGILDYFHPVIDAFEAGRAKSDGRMFRLAAAAAAEAGLQAWHVGDSYDGDVLGAQAAGLRPVLLDRRGDHESPDCLCIADLRGLQALLEKSGR
jgi:putative hydrolase of the HAD superfamily